MSPTLWTPKRFAEFGLGNPRASIVLGQTKPSALTTGPLPGVARTTMASNVTINTPGTLLENVTILGRLTVNVADVTVRNFTAYEAVATNVNVDNLLLEDFALRPGTPAYTYGAGIIGHDFTLRRGRISGFIDGVGVWNTGAAQPYASGVVLEHTWIDKVAYWTSQNPGLIHPSDTFTHNDGIQNQGGWGTTVIGSLIDASFERQYAHWWVTDPTTEPFTSIPLNSLPDGGPWHTIPDTGVGNAASGRYNGGTNSSLTGILIGNNIGTSREMTVTDSWIYGGAFGINLGGFNRGSETNSLGTFLRNRFDRSQGTRGAGGNDTYTIAGAGSGWSGFITSGAGTSNRNYYEDQGNTPTGEINFRGD